MIDLKPLRDRLLRKLGERDVIIKRHKELQNEYIDLKELCSYVKEAQRIAQLVAENTLAFFEGHINNVVTLSLHFVFENPYDFKCKFVRRRNQTECDLTFVRNGTERKPTEASGIGAVDVAAFALRVALWSLESEQKRNLFILDEPFKHLRGKENQRKASAMVRELATDLGLQIIMVADVSFNIEADKRFHFDLINDVSTLTEEEGTAE